MPEKACNSDPKHDGNRECREPAAGRRKLLRNTLIQRVTVRCWKQARPFAEQFGPPPVDAYEQPPAVAFQSAAVVHATISAAEAERKSHQINGIDIGVGPLRLFQ